MNFLEVAKHVKGLDRSLDRYSGIKFSIIISSTGPHEACPHPSIVYIAAASFRFRTLKLKALI